MAEIDKLSIEISSASSDASQKIEKAAASLERLKNSVKGISGLSDAAKGLREIANAANSISSDSAASLKSLSDALRTFSGLKGIKIPANVGNQIAAIGQAIKSVDSYEVEKLTMLADGLKPLLSLGDGKISPSFARQVSTLTQAASEIQPDAIENLKSLADGLRPLTELGKAKLTTFITQLGKLPEVIQQLDAADLEKFNRQMKELADSMVPLATEMQKVSSGFSSFPAKIQGVAKAGNILASGFSLAKFGLMGLGFKQAASAAKGWVTSATDYIEATNLFSVSMGEFYDEAFSYAQLVNEKMGIDTTAWMDTQGTFMLMARGFGVTNEQAYKLSKGLTELSYDISSLKNLEPEEAVGKLRSALAGESEPIRELGLSISQTALQEYALSRGIDEAVASMTEQEKALLRSVKVMEDSMRIGYVGDFARTLESPANAMRVLKQQVSELGRALGSVLLPIITQIIPWIQAFVSVITSAIRALATLVGFTMPEWDSSDWDVGDAGFGEVEQAIGGASGAAKELKRQLMGIDELTVLQEPSAGGGGGGGGAGLSDWASGLEIPEIWSEEMLENIRRQAELLEEPLKDILQTVASIGAGLLAWKIASKLMPDLGKVQGLLGGLLIGVGIDLLIDSVGEILFGDGLTWESILKGIGGGAATGGGVGLLLAKKLGLTWQQGLLKGALIGISASLLLMSILSTVKDGITWEGVLLGTLGGTGLGIALAKSLGLTWAQGALAGGVIAIGLVLVIDAIRDIAMGEGFGENALQAAGGSALLGGTLGMMVAKKLGLSLAASGLPVAAVAVGVSLIVAGITHQIANGVDIAGALTTVLGAVLAGAGIGFMIGGPLGAAVGAAIGLAVGVVLEIVGVQAAGDAAYQATENFQIMADILERSAAASERSTTAMENLKNGISNVDSTIADFALASQLVDEIYAISENANATNEDLALMAVKVDVLNGLGLEGLSLSVDETTGRVKESRQEVENLIASLEQEAKMEALRDLLVQSYKDQYTAMVDAENALRDYDVASQALADTAKELENTSWFSDPQRHAELTAAQKEQTEAVNAAQQAYAASMETLDEVEAAIGTYSDALANMKLAEEDIGTGVSDGLEVVRSSLDETASKMSGYGENIAETLRTSVDSNTKENEYKSIWQRLGDWFKDVFGIASPSTVMMEYGGYIADGLLGGITESWQGIRDFFSESLSELWDSISQWFTLEKWTNMVSSMQTSISNVWRSVVSFWTSSVPQWWNQNVAPWFTLQKWSGMVDTIRASINEKWNATVGEWSSGIKSWWESQVQPWFTKSKWDTTVNSISTSIRETWTETASQWASDISNWWNSSVTPWFTWEKWKQLGSSAIQGLMNGLSNIGSQVRNWASGIIGDVKASFQIRSPSKVFEKEIGLNLGLGIASGIELSGNRILDSLSGITGKIQQDFNELSYDIDPKEIPAISQTQSLLVKYNHDISKQSASNAYYGTEKFEERLQNSNDQIVNVILAVAQRLETAINNQSGDIYMDGVKVGNRTTQAQNRANRMYGRTLQNV